MGSWRGGLGGGDGDGSFVMAGSTFGDWNQIPWHVVIAHHCMCTSIIPDDLPEIISDNLISLLRISKQQEQVVATIDQWE
jgi:hypothetical protein